MPHESSPPTGSGVQLLRQPSSTVAVLFNGEIDASWAPQAQHKLVEALLHCRRSPIVIDLRKATRLDPRVVGAILATVDAASDLRVPLSMLNANAAVTGQLLSSGLPGRYVGR